MDRRRAVDSLHCWPLWPLYACVVEAVSAGAHVRMRMGKRSGHTDLDSDVEGSQQRYGVGAVCQVRAKLPLPRILRHPLAVDRLRAQPSGKPRGLHLAREGV